MTARPSNPIDRFLAAGRFAVVGASPDRSKYGNKVLRCYLRHGRPVVAINPRQQEIEGVPCHASLRAVTPPPGAASIVAPPAAAAGIVADAIAAGVRHLWFQPGAEDAAAIASAERAGIEVIAGGACVLVVLGYRD